MKLLTASALLLASSAASADVVSSDAHGFEVRESVQVHASPALTWASLTHVGRWWSAAHTYSGKSANLTLSTVAGGCFCERLPAGGSVEHMRVSFVDPGKRLVLTGALGPLLNEAVTGVMDIRMEKNETGTRVSVSYKTSGFVHGNAKEIAPAVDSVLREQFERLSAVAGPD